MATGTAGRRTTFPSRVPRRLLGTVLPLLAFFLLTLERVWPWPLHPGTNLAAPAGGDVSSSVVKFGVLTREHLLPFLPGTMHSVGWPEGLKVSWGLDAVSVLSALPVWLLSALLGPIAAHGVWAILGYFLTAAATFFFVRRVTGSVLAGTIAGFSYGFFPHLTLMASAAITYTHMWLFILPLWGLYELALQPTRRRAWLAGLSVVPAIFWTPYYAEHATVLYASGLVALLLLGRRLGTRLPLIAIAFVPVVASGIAQVAIGRITGFEDQPDHPLDDVYQQSAHPLMYLMPGHLSTWTRLGSGATTWSYEQLVDLVPKAQQTNLYVGLSVLALAIVALVGVVWPWLRRGRDDLRGPAIAAALGLAAALGAFLFSLPPKIGGVPMPELAVHALAPGLRAGQRFVMPLMAGLSVAAGVGAWHVLKRFDGTRAIAVGVLLAAIVVVDHETKFPAAWTGHVPITHAIRVLADAPPGPALQATPNGFIGRDPQRACLLQRVHHKQLFNTCTIHDYSANTYRIASIPACDALAELRGRGLRYVIQEPMKPDVIGDCLTKDKRLRGTRTLARDGSYRVWVLRPPKA